MPGNQRTRLVPLPNPRSDWVLVILGGHPPVERESQPTQSCSRGRAARALRPRKQQISAYAMVADQASTLHCHGISPLQSQPGRSPSLTTLSGIMVRDNAHRAAVRGGRGLKLARPATVQITSIWSCHGLPRVPEA
jgi:hypothetical protein